MKNLLIIAIVLLASCSQINPSIVHVDGDYVIIQTVETYGHNDWLSTYIKRKGAIVYNSDLGFEEKHYAEINLDTAYSFLIGEDYFYLTPQRGNSRTVRDSLYCHIITYEDSLTHIDYIDSLSICNELEKALALIESDKLEHLKNSTRKALRLAKIDSVKYWIDNVKELCKE